MQLVAVGHVVELQVTGNVGLEAPTHVVCTPSSQLPTGGNGDYDDLVTPGW